MKIVQIPCVKHFGTIPTIFVVNFQKESWEKQAKVPAMVSPNCFYLWLYVTDGRVRVGCRTFITNFFEVLLGFCFFFFTSTSLWQKFSLSQVFLGEICKVERTFTIIIRILIHGVGKWDWHACSAWSVTGFCLWLMPTFTQVYLSPVGPVPLWIYNYIFIRSKIVCLVIRALLWNVNPSGSCSEK